MVGTVGASLYDYIPIFLALAYVVSLLRDYRPIRSLREENRELRKELEDQGKRYDALEKRHGELEVKCGQLERSRDFAAAFEPLMVAFSAHEKRETEAWAEIAKGLAANTATLQTLTEVVSRGEK